TMARFLKSNPVDEIHPMRKIVIDGSNTTGFQRTTIIANGGKTIIDGKKIGIQTICLEEDAARKIADDDKNNMRIYRLDRLGIPLIEVATDPDIRSPEEAQEVALAIGSLLRSTGRVKRGQGTIRQDVNVSIKNGAIIEIKGLQQLDMLAKTVEYEALRQEKLLEIRDTLRNRGITVEKIKDKITDVSAVFVKSESKVIKTALKSGGTVYAVKLPGFAGLLGIEVQPERRFGTEISDYAKFWGRIGGIFHTDELPKYGISDADVSEIRRVLKTKEEDAVVLVASSKNRCKDALNAVVNRACEAIRGVPAETRMPLPEGTSKFARPRPGSSRMYPETDVRPVKITENRLTRIKKNMPETLENKEKRFIREYNLSSDLAFQITRSVNLSIFEHIIKETKISPTLVAATLENTVVSLHRDQIPIENLQEYHFINMFKLVEQNELSSQAIPDVLIYLANNPSLSVDEALAATGLSMVGNNEVAEIIRKIVRDREEFIREQGERSFGGLMGIVMKELGGKVDGKTVKQLLTAEINKLLKT
ncbi:Glu-tRNA(Gln) amidotransferase subunit GatE, partial [Candidatus Thorarchaeota archaeon]